MFHKAVSVEFREGTSLDVTFRSGEVKRYDISVMYQRYPQLKALEDRALFTSGKLQGGYGIVWSDELDLDVETVFDDGIVIGMAKVSSAMKIGNRIAEVRSEKKLTQTMLAKLCGIDQGDLSKIENGTGNPSLATLERIANALGMDLELTLR